MSNVSFEEFSARFAKDLEIPDDYYLGVPLKDVSEYDSMGKINASLTIEELFGFQIDYEILAKEETITSLYEFCVKKAEEA